MSLEQRIYNASPRWLRDALVTTLGVKLAVERYTGRYRELRGAFAAIGREPVEVWRARQERLLVDFVRHAAERSPLLRDRYAGLPLPRSIAELPTLPLLTKDILRPNLERLRTGPLRRGLVCVHTSGTTGTPMTFFFTRDDYQGRMAVLDDYRSWFGVRHREPRATFSGRVVVPPGDRSGRFWQTNHALRQRLYSTYHLSADNLPAYIADLEQWRPRLVDGYPSALAILARHLLARGHRLAFVPRTIHVTAETLREEDRAAITEAFRCPVRNQYASSEGAPFIVECEEGRLHFLPHTGVLEVIDDQGRPAEEGEAIFTSFHTHFMPLVRYQIGDRVRLSQAASCPCDRTWPLVEAILGRQEDTLLATSGARVGRLDPVFKKMPASIVRSQIIQRERGEVEVLYVPDGATFQPAHLDGLRGELHARLGEDMRLRFTPVADIPTHRNGKLKAVICAIKEDPPN